MATFGHAMLAEWAFEPDLLYLNHGTVGAPPRRVLAAQSAIRDEIERQPSRFMLRELSAIASGEPWSRPRMRLAADSVAGFVGARGDDLVFVDNATTGCNAVLRSLDLRPDDEILVTDLGYGAITLASRYAARARGATVREVTLPFPGTTPGGVTEAIERACTPRTRLLVIDHITSHSALILPVAELTARAHSRGIAVLVDGAHAPGAIPLDVPSLGADWYAANLHKWAWSPRSAGFLWTVPARQRETHPVTISWGLDQGYTTEFDWVGTHDPTRYLAAPAALAFLRELGVAEVMRYDHELAWAGASLLAERWGEPLPCPESMVGTMATVMLPARSGATAEDAIRLRDALLDEDRIEAQIHAHGGRLWVRLSAQVYNELGDVERFARAVEARV